MREKIITPNKIGPYFLTNILGEGAFSIVKIAIHEINKLEFACKIIPKKKLGKEYSEEHIQLEIKILISMNHPNIIRFHDLFQDTINFYIIMELFSNNQLFLLISKNGKLIENRAKRIFKQIALAINYLHLNGIAHRDIKLENILIDNNDNIKLIDFGLSSYFKEDELLSIPCGSPIYASPEIVLGIPYDGFKTDIWSLGVVLFFLVFGQSPWTSNLKNIVFSQIKNMEFFIPINISENCTSLINSMMCFNPLKRFSINNVLKSNWLIDINIDINKFYSDSNWNHSKFSLYSNSENLISNNTKISLLSGKGVLALAHRKSISINRNKLKTISLTPDRKFQTFSEN